MTHGADTVERMFGALGRIASRRPWLVILAWLVFVVLVVALAPPFKATNDQADFLPRHYESIKAAELQQDAFPQDNTIGAIVVFDRKDGAKLTEDDQAQIAAVVQGLDGNLGKAFVSITGRSALRERPRPARRRRAVRGRDRVRHPVLRRGQEAAQGPRRRGDR